MSYSDRYGQDEEGEKGRRPGRRRGGHAGARRGGRRRARHTAATGREARTQDGTSGPEPDDVRVAGSPGAPAPAPGRSAGGRRRAARTGWRRYAPSWKAVAGITGLMTAGGATLLGVAYANTPIPSEAQATAVAQESVIYYSDGRTPIARIGMHRRSVPLDRIPMRVRHAVLAAEDRGFYSQHGISFTGVARAVFQNVTGGDVQGGSTITQQLARNYYEGLSRDRTFSRKLKEAMVSVRLNGEREKDQILELYLNTVAFGRQAYGIQAAARAYFHKDVARLAVAEAALLAAMIQQPGYFVTRGPADRPAKKALIDRWNYVLDGMVEEGWLSPRERAAQRFPTTEREWSDIPDSPQAGYLKKRVLAELAELGVTDAMLERGGLRITTTFDRKKQRSTATLVERVRRRHGLDADVHFGLAAVDPGTGGVVAAYGGPGYAKQQFDDSFQGRVQPGSSFKPIVLATALDQGIGLRTRMDGSYRRVIAGDAFTNDNRGENGVYTIAEMTELSINTAYVDLGQRVGLDNVAEMARKMGVPGNTRHLDSGYTSLPLGTVAVSPVTMASVYATFAAEGTHTRPHVISRITDRHGDPVHTERGTVLSTIDWETTTAFSPRVARDATAALQRVVRSGTGTRAGLGGRPVAGKTGTTDENRSAWFVGYTPRLATSVAMWREGPDGELRPLRGIGGYEQIYGGTLPADLFRRFMTAALDGEPVRRFGPPGDVGATASWSVPRPSPSPTPTPTPSPTCTRGPSDPSLLGGAPATGEPCPSATPAPAPPTAPGTTPDPREGCDVYALSEQCAPRRPPPPRWCALYPSSPQCAPYQRRP